MSIDAKFSNLSPWKLKYLFATVPGLSINSWDSWFIFNLRKINTCYYMNTACARKWTATVGNNSMYILNNVYLECWFFNKHVSGKEDWIFLCKHTSIDLCTYFGFGFLEAPREHVLHGPFLGIYWLQLCPHFEAPTPEATLLQRRLFIVLMTAAHISPNIFSLQLFLASAYWLSYYNRQ